MTVRKSNPFSKICVVLTGALIALGVAGACKVRPSQASGLAWTLYNGNLAGDRFSWLAAINRSNVASLHAVCQRVVAPQSAFESGPVVVASRIYVTTADSTIALDARTCAMIWRTENSYLKGDVANVNRGVAYFDGQLFRGTTDGYVLALNAQTGEVKWSRKVIDPAKGERFTMAPIAWHGLAFIGDAVSDNGIHGEVMAFRLADGRKVWQRSTIDDASWPRGAAKGGGGTWSSFSLDPKPNILFVSASNPAPDFFPAARPGKNLYTNSVLALDALSGNVRWYFQVTPHDEHDWDLGAAPMLFSLDGTEYVAAGSKDGNLYVIDRRKHTLLYRVALTTIENAGTRLTTRYLHVCPGLTGGVEWNGPAFDALNQQIVVGAVDWCGQYRQTPNQLLGPAGFMGGEYAPDPPSTSRGWLNAVDARSGKVRWRYHASRPIVGGVTPTAGGVTFAGDTAGDFFAFDSATGQVLRRLKLSASVSGGIVPYEVGGREFIVVATGPTLRTTFAKTGDPTVTIFATAN